MITVNGAFMLELQPAQSCVVSTKVAIRVLVSESPMAYAAFEYVGVSVRVTESTV
jgi:hypothetical protein